MPTPDPTQIIFAALWDMKGWLAFIILFFIAGAVLKAFDSKIKGWAGERAIKRILDKNGFKHLHDLYLPSRDGVTQIDHIAMVGGVIVVIETKNYGGWIFGEKRQKLWRQSLAGGRVKIPFQNPLRQNYAHRKAVEAVVGPGVNMVGLVVFSPRAHFPKGIPEGVIRSSDLKSWLAAVSRGGQEAPTSAWKRLEECVANSDRKVLKYNHLATVKKAQDLAR